MKNENLEADTYPFVMEGINFCCVSCEDTFLDGICLLVKKDKKINRSYIFSHLMPVLGVFCKKCHSKYWDKINELNKDFTKKFFKIIKEE